MLLDGVFEKGSLMNRCISWWACGWLLLAVGTSSLWADPLELVLGDKPSLGFFQPRVSVEIFEDAEGQNSLGPESSSFLLDSGASGVVIYPPATTELARRGFVNEGVYDEIGIAGTHPFDLSAPYRFEYSGTDGGTHALTDVRMLSGDDSPDELGLMELHGIVGMPAMTGQVTTLDNRTREGALPLSMRVLFSDALPTATTHRFTVPLQELAFPAEGEGPLPTFESLSTLQVRSQHGGKQSSNSIILDSGAQVSIISSKIANALELDANGNGDFMDESIATLKLRGASSTIDAPVLMVDRMSIPTDQGYELTWSNAQVVVFDIHPRIDGVLGADFMSDDGGLDLSLLGGETGDIGDLLGSLLGGGGGGLDELLGGLLGGGGGGLDELLGGLLGGGGGLDLGGLDLGGLLGGGGLGDLLGPAAADDGLDDLLGDLGGLGGLLGGGSDLFSRLPLESYFDQVHFDFRRFPDSGQLVFDVNPTISAGILNGDHVFDQRDIDDLTNALGTSAFQYDLNGDGTVDAMDRHLLVEQVFDTVAGDTDLDGDVDFADFVAMSVAFGEADTGWATGDFDGDGSTSFPDFVALSLNFNSAATPASVPEPNGLPLLLAAFAACLLRGRARRR